MRHWSQVLLVITGFLLVLVGLIARQDSLGRIGVGAGLLLAGAFSDRLQRAKVGPGGAEIELGQRTRESTTELAVEPTGPQSPPALADPDEVVDVHRVALANDVVSYLTDPAQGPLTGCAFQLYLFDVDKQMLLPVLESGHDGPSPGFSFGEGVAGKAWETGEFAIAEGAATHDETFALAADKQLRYSDLAVVAAVPVTNASARAIAVLSASSAEPASGLATQEGFEALVALAERIARVLIDILKWFDDDYDET